jgi:hypothetical protein
MNELELVMNELELSSGSLELGTGSLELGTGSLELGTGSLELDSFTPLLIIQESAKNHPRTTNPSTDHTTIQQYTHKISLSNRLLQKLKEKTHLEIKPKS